MASSIYALQNLVKARLYYVLRRCLSQSRRNALKEGIKRSRKRLAKAYELVYGKFGAEDLVRELGSKIPGDFEILMVHSSFDGLLPMFQGRPEEVVNALIEFCGKDRTLAMPAFFLGGRLYDSVAYYRTHRFDARRTPSEMGLITEVFRRKPGVLRSLHPTHSICAFGPLARELTGSHHLASTRTGKGTPFELMTRKRTVIAGIGVEYYRCLTQTHTAEDLLGDEFPVSFRKQSVPVRLVDLEGNEVPYELTVLRSDKVLDNTLLRSLLSKEELVEWKYKGVSLFFTFAHRVTEVLLKAAAQGITVFGKFEDARKVPASGVPAGRE